MFRKTQSGKMGILTVPQGTRLYRRKTGGTTFERASKEFDVLAMPTRSKDGEPAYSIKLRNEYWYVLQGDIPSE